MMAGEEALEEEDPSIEGWVMIMLVDMNVRWEVGMGMLMKGLMAGTWVVHLVAFRVVLPVIGIQAVVGIVMLPI